MRISAIQTKRDFDLERQREALRDRRWVRRKSMVITLAGCCATIVTACGPGAGAAKAIFSLVGL